MMPMMVVCIVQNVIHTLNLVAMLMFLGTHKYESLYSASRFCFVSFVWEPDVCYGIRVLQTMTVQAH